MGGGGVGGDCGIENHSTYLVMFQTGYHDLRQDDHACAANPSTAVHQDRQVCVLWIAGAVGVPPHGLDLLQVRWDRIEVGGRKEGKGRIRSCLDSTTH